VPRELAKSQFPVGYFGPVMVPARYGRYCRLAAAQSRGPEIRPPLAEACFLSAEIRGW
jgi:hypothetical protein